MPDRFTNLLPPERDRLLARDYALRVTTLTIALTTALTFSAAVLLVPTYVFLNGNERAKKTQLANIESTLSPTDDNALSARLAELSNKAATLVALSKTRSTSAIVRDALVVARSGVTLSSFSYTPPGQKKQGTLVLSGSSATRDALRDYQLALQSAPWASSAVLPVSAYAKDANIAFTITLTLVP